MGFLAWLMGRERSPATAPASIRPEAQAFTIDDAEPQPIPVEDWIDLHTFRPAEVRDVVRSWLEEVSAAGLSPVRIVHGKGKGVLRRTVHAELSRNPAVLSYQEAPPHLGGWGATLVWLRPTNREEPR